MNSTRSFTDAEGILIHLMGIFRKDAIETDSDTDLLTRPILEEDDGGHDRFAHYVKKDKIAESAVMGSHVVALCGEVFPVTRAAKPGSPVCPDCKRIYESLKKG